MLEAVNSVLQTAPLVRGHVEQVGTADSYAANPERVQRAQPQAPYISPYIYLDVNYDRAVIQLRNGETGDVEDQFPSEASLEAAARQAARRELARTEETAPTVTPRTTTRAPDTQDAEAPPPPSSSGGTTPAPTPQPSITPQQKAAFQAAAQSGNANAGNVTLFA